MQPSDGGRFTDTSLLEGRIAANQAAQSIDFNQWVFQGIQIPPDSRILELCCGIGTQTTEFLKRLDRRGCYIGVDKSQKALDRIRETIPPELSSRVTLLCSDMDLALKDYSIQSRKFDLIFCSYGLYYSSDAWQLLSDMKDLLQKDGQIIIVGPHGSNNDSLLRTLEGAGVVISPHLKYISRGFMYDVVIPWGILHFRYLTIRTMVNPVIWNTPDQVLEYWKNTAFFDQEKISAVADQLREHFAKEPNFINEKHVMMVTIKHEPACGENTLPPTPPRQSKKNPAGSR